MARNALLKLHLRVQELVSQIEQLAQDVHGCKGELSQAQLISIIDGVVAFNKLYFSFLGHKNSEYLSQSDKQYVLALDTSFKELGPSVRALRHVVEPLLNVDKAMREALARSDALGRAYEEEQKVVDETSTTLSAEALEPSYLKKSIAKNHWRQLKEHVLNANHRHISFSRRLQVTSEYIRNFLDNIESTLVERALGRCDSHYQSILRVHQNHLSWLTFLQEIYIAAQKNIDGVLDGIEEKAKLREALFKELGIGLISLALAPVGLDKVLSPVISALQKNQAGKLSTLMELEGIIGAELAQGQKSSDKMHFKGVFEPVQVIEVAKLYTEHKMKGVLADAYQIFNPEQEDNPILGELKPRQLIRELIHRKINEIKATMTQVDWSIMCENEFRKLREKLLQESETELSSLIDDCFKPIKAQLEPRGESSYFSRLVESIHFDDTQAGEAAVNQKLKKELAALLQNRIENTILMQVGKSSRHFFGKMDEEGCWSNTVDEYGRYPSFKTRQLLSHILKRHDTVYGTDKRYQSLLEREPGKYLLTFMGHDPFNTQMKRQAMLNDLFSYYEPGDLEGRLKQDIKQFADKHEIEVAALPESPTAGGEHWVAEQVLASQVKDTFSTLVSYCESQKTVAKEEVEVLREIELYRKAKSRLRA